MDERGVLEKMFRAAVESALPDSRVPLYLPPAPVGRLLVVGAGKAAAAMARTFEHVWKGKIDRGLVVTRYGHAVPCDRIEVVEAGHPLPDEAGSRAGGRMLDMVRGLGDDDLVVCLLSGGGSSLLPLPFPGITLDDKQEAGRQLLKSGAAISEINCVRRHLSAIKGGRLAAACYPARVLTLAISDVPGDNAVDIASGPTVGDPTTCADALAIIARYGLDLPSRIIDLLRSGRSESIKPEDPRLRSASFMLIATPGEALKAAARVAKEHGITPYILSDRIEGEAREVGKVLAALALEVADRGQPFVPPCVLLSGGETTVTVRGSGRGGRNVEFLLSLAIHSGGHPRLFALAGDTDGVDGREEIAGAVLTPDTLARARSMGIDPRHSLDDNDGHTFFRSLGDSIITGPTLTNVNDFRAILITG